ncbi:MAG TPA: DNA polymerase II, partial [Bacteroidia bacterium]|nr:DNA polymerase II [Bacteroidia bacterium]
AKAALRSAWFYGRWYPALWLPVLRGDAGVLPEFRADSRRVRALSKRLARSLFHAMLRHGPKLEKKQVLLGRFVEIGAELFALTAAMAYAGQLVESGRGDREDLVATVRHFAKLVRGKVEGLFREVRRNADAEGYRIAKGMLEGRG